ncbi:hypothetical protein ACTXT7_010325 [Hymenolepis weldensis]
MSAPPLMQKDLGQPPPYTETAPPYPMAPGYPPAPGYGPAPGYPPPGPGYPQGPPVPPPGGHAPPPVIQQPTRADLTKVFLVEFVLVPKLHFFIVLFGVCCQSTIVYTANTLGPGPSRFYCTNCQREVLTNVTYESGLFTWLLVALICILGELAFSDVVLSPCALIAPRMFIIGAPTAKLLLESTLACDLVNQ